MALQHISATTHLNTETCGNGIQHAAASSTIMAKAYIYTARCLQSPWRRDCLADEHAPNPLQIQAIQQYSFNLSLYTANRMQLHICNFAASGGGAGPPGPPPSCFSKFCMYPNQCRLQLQVAIDHSCKPGICVSNSCKQR